jgi:hypothetical protein
MRFFGAARLHGWRAQFWGRVAGAVLRSTVTCLAASMALLPAGAGTIKVAPAVVADNPEAVQGVCSLYQSTLMSQGVIEPNGMKHPGDCRHSGFEPLFDGKTLADYWTSVTQGTARP